jgi:hypothetical protein
MPSDWRQPLPSSAARLKLIKKLRHPREQRRATSAASASQLRRLMRLTEEAAPNLEAIGHEDAAQRARSVAADAGRRRRKASTKRKRSAR